MDILENAVVFLLAGLVGVFVFKRIGLGSVLGYLFAGVIIGPYALAFIDEYEEILSFSELGVVFLLFIIGLELSPKRLWRFRALSLGFGGLQVFTTGIALSIPLYLFFTESIGLSLILGFGFSLSSTAMILQILSERDELSTPHGQASFGALLFQDIAAIPLIALIPILAAQNTNTSSIEWEGIIKALAITFAVVLAGIYLVEPILRAIAKLKVPELLLAASLLIVLSLALTMHSVGLSMALGSFLGGVVLSGSSYKHHLETSIEPFKSLLMGLFFIAIGMSVELSLLVERPIQIFVGLCLLISIKFIIALFYARLFKRSWADSLNVGANLCQAGEFVFIIVSILIEYSVVQTELASNLKIIIGLSMLLTPFIIQSSRYLTEKFSKNASPDISDLEQPIAESSKVIVIGYGRFGQIISRVLRLKKISITVIDNNPDHIRYVKKYGAQVFFGNACDVNLLRNAGAGGAELFVIAIDKVDVSLKLVKTAQEHFPHLKIFARARNRQHLLALKHYGVDYCIRDTLYSALKFTERALESLGLPFSTASSAVELFREHDERVLELQQEHWQDDGKLSEISKKWTKEMESLLESDAASKN